MNSYVPAQDDAGKLPLFLVAGNDRQQSGSRSSMLNSLRSIVQEVNAARDLKTALAIIVSRVKQAMHTQVCSVYLADPKGAYVLMATDGLNLNAVGRVRL